MNVLDYQWLAWRVFDAAAEINRDWQDVQRVEEQVTLLRSEEITLGLHEINVLTRKTSLEGLTMSITGASHLSQSIRELVDTARAKVASAHNQIGDAVDNLGNAATSAVAIADAINAEANDLLSGVARFTNGAPTVTAPAPKATPLPPAPTISGALAAIPSAPPLPNTTPATPLPPAPTIATAAEPKKNEGT